MYSEVEGMIEGKKTHKLGYDDESRIIELYNSGMSSGKIAEVVGISESGVLYTLHKNNVKFRDVRIHKVNENVFDNVDSNDKAGYWYGFLEADGSIRKKNITLILSANDKIQLEKFRYFMDSDAPINEFMRYSYGKMRPYVSITINSMKVASKLMELGLDKERKNKFPYWMNEKVFRHWLRGLWDGDGTIGVRIQKRDNKRYLYVNLIGYYNLVSEVENWLVRILGVKRNKIYKNSVSDKVYSIKWSGSDAEKIADYLYGDADEDVRLDRKYAIYMKWKRGEV